MTRILFAQLPRTARGSLCTAFQSVGVEVALTDSDEVARSEAAKGTRVVSVLRHPVDRLQSYFNFRLRAGRPHQPELWSATEAALFSVLHTYDDFCQALLSTDELRRSIAECLLYEFGRQHKDLGHVFGDPSTSPIHVAGTFDDLSAAVEAIATLAGCRTPTLTTDPSVIDATPPSLRSALSPVAQMGMRVHMAEEIALYDMLNTR